MIHHLAVQSAVKLPLSTLAAGGEAVGRLDEGLVVFVPGGAPGDLVEVEVTERRKGYARGRLIRLLAPGADRVTPVCALSQGPCGGCPWMHVTRSAQLLAKEELVRRALRHTEAAIRPILAPTADLGYRIRARLVLRCGRLGFQGARSHEVVDMPDCPVLVPALNRALGQAVPLLRGTLGEQGTLAGLVGAGARVHLALTLGEGGEPSRVQAALTSLVTEGVIAGASLGGWHCGLQAVDVGGPLGLLPAAADNFAQASAAGHADLVTLVDAAVGAGPEGQPWGRILELYAGGGNLTRLLRGRARAVVAVEGDRGAAARLSTAFAGGAGVSVMHDSAERAVAALLRTGERFDVAVLDPPRAGAAEVVPALARLGLRRIVYVSCDPMTLGRDLERLGKLGFVARSAQPLDLMPHSAHVEVVAVADAATADRP